MKRRRTWLGMALVLVGLGLILHRSGLYPIGGREIFWGALALAGCGIVVRGWTAGAGKGVFWGTLLAIIAIAQLLATSGLVCIPGRLWVPLLLIAIGAAFAVRCVRTPREWHLLIPGTGFIMLGTAILLLDAGIISGREFLEGFWIAGPIAMAVFGAALLVNRKTA